MPTYLWTLRALWHPQISVCALGFPKNPESRRGFPGDTVLLPIEDNGLHLCVSVPIGIDSVAFQVQNDEDEALWAGIVQINWGFYRLEGRISSRKAGRLTPGLERGKIAPALVALCIWTGFSPPANVVAEGGHQSPLFVPIMVNFDESPASPV